VVKKASWEMGATALLKKGSNAILLRVTNVNGGWSFCFRVTDQDAERGLAG
jgi:hypothetical protein